jgi:hypothetical protein
MVVNNSINIIKTKESLNIKTKESLIRGGQQFHQLMELLTITVKTFFCFDDIDGIVDHHCKNFLLF